MFSFFFYLGLTLKKDGATINNEDRKESKIRKNAKIYQILLFLESSSKDRVLKKLQFGNFGVKIFLTCS